MSRWARVLIGTVAGVLIGMGIVSLRPSKAPAMKWDAIPTTIKEKVYDTPRDPMDIKPW